MSSVSRAKLRTKTGCLTCRQRRKKCNEKAPVCDGCRASTRRCRWPTSADLLDRRFASHNDSRHGLSTPKSESDAVGDSAIGRQEVRMRDGDGERNHVRSPAPIVAPRPRLLAESATAHGVISRELPVVLSQHFAERYFSLLLLPCCHPGFHDGWLAEIQDLMVSHKSLYFSVLACAASHIHLMDMSTPAQALALTYYTNATRELSGLLKNESRLENHNGLLMSIMLLYLHGCMGLGTYTDIPIHVNAATRILTMRLLNRQMAIDHLFDRLAVESVLYQIFLVTTGLWTQKPGADYEFDAEFWHRAEWLLDKSTFFPGQSMSFNSPVLGVPVSLFRVALVLRGQYGTGLPPDVEALRRIRGEVEHCEALLLYELGAEPQAPSERVTAKEVYYRDARCLYAIIVLLLLEQLLCRGDGAGPRLPEPSSDSWQVRKAIQILRRHRNEAGWSRCYIGNWPVYTLGFFMGSPEDQEVIRSDLQRRWNLTRFAQVFRFHQDLEAVWAEREPRACLEITTK